MCIQELLRAYAEQAKGQPGINSLAELDDDDDDDDDDDYEGDQDDEVCMQMYIHNKYIHICIHR